MSESAEKPGQAPSFEPDGQRVVICDRGGLDDVLDVLGRTGERASRVRPEELEGLADHERPTRLFVTTADIAVAHRPALDALVRGAPSIAVAESGTPTPSEDLLRSGFHYVIRRPVHPEALRLLLIQLLFRGREYRGVARFPFGAAVRWRSGLRTGRCTMTEISAHGCRLVTRSTLPLGGRVRLRVPPALPTLRRLGLRGRVVRRDSDEDENERPFAQIAVRFEGLSQRTRAHLDALIAEHAGGPVSIEAAKRAAPLGRESRDDRSRGEAVDAGAGAGDGERRRRPRALWQSEVVAFDDTQRAIHTLMGSDLSTGGMRVAPHPLLKLGDRLKLALFDVEHPGPLMVVASVTRDDGERGFGLVFEALEEPGRSRLESMMARLPVSALDDSKGEPERVVLSEIRDLEAPSKQGR